MAMLNNFFTTLTGIIYVHFVNFNPLRSLSHIVGTELMFT